MDKRQIYIQLQKDFDRKRATARKELEERRAEVYASIPRIEEIDAEIAASGFDAAFFSLDNPARAKEGAKSYKEKCDTLLKEKNALLKENGIPRKYLELRYECKRCEDTGYVDGAECSCFRQKRVELAYGAYSAYDASEMSKRLRGETFDHFDFRYYSSKKPDNKPFSPKKNMEMNVEYSLKYTKNFERKRENLLFYGKPGLGKTFLCNSIAKELIDYGYFVVYVTAFTLFKLLNDAQFGKLEEDNALLADISAADLLIIDDIGTEFTTTLTEISLFNILNTRALNGKPVLISTNLDPEGIKELYSERVYSRILGDYKMFEFYGEDIRQLKKYGKFLE